MLVVQAVLRHQRKGRISRAAPDRINRVRTLFATGCHLQTGRVSFLSTAVMLGCSSSPGNSMVHTKPVRQLPPAADGKRRAVPVGVGNGTAELEWAHAVQKPHQQLQLPPWTMELLPT